MIHIAIFTNFVKLDPSFNFGLKFDEGTQMSRMTNLVNSQDGKLETTRAC